MTTGVVYALRRVSVKKHRRPRMLRLCPICRQVQSRGYINDVHFTSLEMGGGKSAVAVGLCEHDAAMHVLVMCPKSVMGVWPKQFREHGLRDYDFWTNTGSGTTTRKAQSLASFLLRPGTRPKVVVINYDVWWRDAISQLVLGWKWDVEVLDESHKIKSPGGKASRMASKMEKHCKRKVLLTGTPQPHGPEDIYAQFRAADPRIFGTNFNQHKNRYFSTRKINDKIDVVTGFRDDRQSS
jgi:hypothetical protein